MNEAEIAALFERNGLDPDPKEIERVHRAYQGYRSQLEALRALDLDGEEVGTAFLPPPSGGDPPG